MGEPLPARDDGGCTWSGDFSASEKLQINRGLCLDVQSDEAGLAQPGKSEDNTIRPALRDIGEGGEELHFSSVRVRLACARERQQEISGRGIAAKQPKKSGYHRLIRDPREPGKYCAVAFDQQDSCRRALLRRAEHLSATDGRGRDPSPRVCGHSRGELVSQIPGASAHKRNYREVRFQGAERCGAEVGARMRVESALVKYGVRAPSAKAKAKASAKKR